MTIKKTITDNSSLSKSGEKRSELLIKVDNLMEKMDNEYGPFILDELSKRDILGQTNFLFKRAGQ